MTQRLGCKKGEEQMIKKVLQSGLFAFAGIFLVVANADASPMVNDRITLDIGTYQSGVGGEFLLTSATPGNDYAFVTFCLERNEYFYPGRTYVIESIEPFAKNGGKGIDANSSTGTDYISNTTKWLMNEYIFNYDSLWDGRNKAEFAGLMQDTVWFLENEITSLDDDYLLTYAQSQMGDDFSIFYTPGYLDNIQVANITDAYGNPKQSQLFAKPVPEPATMLLFGTGLIGLAAVSRKKFKR